MITKHTVLKKEKTFFFADSYNIMYSSLLIADEKNLILDFLWRCCYVNLYWCLEHKLFTLISESKDRGSSSMGKCKYLALCSSSDLF